jgi:hypothetical protein
MRTGSFRSYAVLGILALAGGLRAQAPQTPPQPLTLPAATGNSLLPTEPKPLVGPQAGVPPVDHGPVEPPHAADAGDSEGSTFQGLFLSGEYLLLRPRRDALDYAVVSPNRTETPGGNVNQLSYGTENGFRTGIGYHLPSSDWSIAVNYTYFHSSDNQIAIAPSAGALYPSLTSGGSFDIANSANASTNLDYNVIDLEAIRHIAVHESFDLTVFGGGRFAWIDQKLQAIYNGGSEGPVNDTVSSPVYFRGAGITLGGLGQWNVYQGIGLYAKAQCSLLSGQFRNSLTETNDNGTVSIVNVHDNYNQIVPVTEMGLGVAYQGDHFHLSVGYELTNWFNMIQSLDFPDSTNYGKIGRRTGDLSLEGLAVQLGLVF